MSIDIAYALAPRKVSFVIFLFLSLYVNSLTRT